MGPAAGLDSYKAYTVEYDAVEAGYMRDKGTHFDNAEITLNVSLTDEHEGGELYFVRWGEETPSFLSVHTNTTRDDRLVPVEHRKGVGVLHRGGEMHGAMPLAAGARTNLIIWFRSSEVSRQ